MVGLILYPFAAAIAWGAACLKARQLVRSGRTAPRVAVAVACLLLALAYTSTSAGPLAPTFWRGVAEALGEDFKPLLQQLCVMGFAASLLVLLVWAYAPEQVRARLRRQLAGAGVTLAVAAVLYVLAKPRYSPRIDMPWEIRSPLHLAYTVLYLPVLAAMLGQVTRLSWRYHRAASRSWLSRGLLLLALGGAVGAVYAVSRLVQVIVAQAGFLLACLDPFVQTCAAFAGSLIVVGLTATSWGPATSNAWT